MIASCKYNFKHNNFYIEKLGRDIWHYKQTIYASYINIYINQLGRIKNMDFREELLQTLTMQ